MDIASSLILKLFHSISVDWIIVEFGRLWKLSDEDFEFEFQPRSLESFLR